jgi:hypothetical protein
MAAYPGMAAPPVFWPLLLFVDAGASAAAGLPAQGLAPIDAAIELMGGPDSDSALSPELLLLKGDLLAALEADDVTAPSASTSSYASALQVARRLGVRMSELRAATRLCRSASGAERDEREAELRSLLAAFSEGAGTADLIEAREALEASSP